MKLRFYRYFSLLLAATLLFGCAGTLSEKRLAEVPTINPPLTIPETIPSFPSIEGRHPDVEAEYEPVAENDALRLYVNKASSAVILEDKRSNTLWRTSPQDLKEDKNTTNVWRNQIEVPIQVSYVDFERSQPKNVKPNQVKQEVSPVKDGIKVAYQFPKDDLSLDLIYNLQGSCLNVILPNASIVESGVNNLVSIEILPFMGATHDGGNGYIVYPDGSGALMHFTTPHSQEVQKMVGVVYGSDASGGQASGGPRSGVYRQNLPMPVFGLVKDQSGFVGFVTQGDFDTGISVGRAGKGVNYNHVWSQFIFRRQGRFSITGGQPAWLYQPDRIPGDRQVRYCFLNGEKANYTGMAEVYRDFLINERGATRLPAENSLMSLGLFMGTERRNWILRDMISMTTFNQAGQILDNLDEAGIAKIDVTLWNWDKGSISVKFPQSFPVDERLGGEEGLHSLVDNVHQHGQRIFLITDIFSVSPGAKGILPYLDAVRGVDGLPLGNSDTGYVLNPQVALERLAQENIQKAKRLGVDGFEYNAFANIALPDKNSRFPLTREGFAATWMKIAKLSSDVLGSVSMTGSNIYASAFSSRLDGVPLDSTHYDIFDETIPLYQIAVHGLTLYTGEPFNLVSDSQRMLLRQIEYGAIPFFVLTYESSSNLARTNWNAIYSSQYEFWRDDVIQQYKLMEKISPLLSQFIIDHQKLSEGVYQTTFEDGTRILVNYNTVFHNDGTVEIPPMDFVIVKGD